MFAAMLWYPPMMTFVRIPDLYGADPDLTLACFGRPMFLAAVRCHASGRLLRQAGTCGNLQPHYYGRTVTVYPMSLEGCRTGRARAVTVSLQFPLYSSPA